MKWLKPHTKTKELEKFSRAIEKLEEVVLLYDMLPLHPSALEIPSDHYVELRYNIKARRLKSGKDIQFGHEVIYSDAINQADFENNIVLLIQFDLGEGFPAHHHLVKELIRCLKGSYKDGMSNITYTEGDTQYIYPLQIHSFVPLEKGFAIIELQKKIKS